MKVKRQKVKGKIGAAPTSSRFLLLVFTFFLLPFTFATPAAAQRDYFTPEEIEMIRDAQQIDQRVDLLVKLIDRRFGALNIDVGSAKVLSKDSEKWGTLAGGRSDYFLDIKRIMQKTIDDIDNLSARPDSMVVDIDPSKKDKKPKGFGDLFPKAVRNFAHAAARWKPPLTTALASTKDGKERGSILDSIDMCDEIIASVAKLPAQANKEKH